MVVPIAFLFALVVPTDTVRLTPGMVITRSVVVRPDHYRLAPTAPDSAVIRIRGVGVVIDFAGAELAGSDPDQPPDRAAGIGILVEAGSAVTIRRAHVRGFKVGLLARGTRGLLLHDNDFSYNWKPRLYSGLGHESLADWLSFHRNEQDEWLRYGAAVYLVDVEGGEVRGNVARHGMNGLQLVRTRRLRIWNNDVSFNSGLGIGMYRATDNVIMHNRADYCVRGSVDGVYQRGQDSAALLMYEQSSNNIVAFNSMSHSGDGLFLWAGQTTMDSGQGGANDNLFFGNDFSFAPTNGMEATFSRNRFIGNLVEGATHGLWGGYSYLSEVRANLFRNNVIGIAIEHGQSNRIADNRFEGDQTAVRLWWNRLEPSDWGYPKQRDTRSRGYRIEGNAFVGNRVAIRAANTDSAVVSGNRFVGVDSVLVAADTSDWTIMGSKGPAPSPAGRLWSPPRDRAAPEPIPGGHRLVSRIPLSRPGSSVRSLTSDPAGRPPRGRHGILVDAWGPFDWQRPLLWPAHRADSAYRGGPLAMVVVGPRGTWRAAALRGATISPRQGRVGDTVVVTPSSAPGAPVDWRVELAYRGGRVVSRTGAVTGAGKEFRFAASRFVVPTAWRIRVFEWDSIADPRRNDSAFRQRLAGPPVVARADSSLDYLWYRPRLPGFPAERFAVVAETDAAVPEGGADLLAISDDAIRVWVDDRLVIDRWAPHESAVDRVRIESGRHRLRVEYYQVDGWVELRVEISREDQSQ